MTHMLLNDVQEMRIRIRKDPSLAVIRRACPAVYFPSTNPKTKGEKGVEERRRKEGKKERKKERGRRSAEIKNVPGYFQNWSGDTNSQGPPTRRTLFQKLHISIRL